MYKFYVAHGLGATGDITTFVQVSRASCMLWK